MTSNSETCSRRYALLGNGANFSCEVLQCLQQSGLPPTLLILPEYAPAASAIDAPQQLVEAGTNRRLLSLAAAIPVAYAPATEQERCAQLLRQRAIDFLLVACWPYLIKPILIDSVTNAALNLHPSMLPRYRGPDPIGAQLASGDRPFGVTLHLLNAGFDAGDIVAQSSLTEIASAADRNSIERLAAKRGSELFIDALNQYDSGWQIRPQSQSAGPGEID